jgi:hypothetical protein
MCCYYRSCDTISDILLLLFVRYYLWHPVIIVCVDVIPDIMLLFLAWILFLTSCYYCLCGFYSTRKLFKKKDLSWIKFFKKLKEKENWGNNLSKKSLKIPKGYSESVSWRTENVMAKRKRTFLWIFFHYL